VCADFSSPESTLSAAQEAKERLRFCGSGGRMLLINNAGVGEYSEFDDEDEGRIKDIMSINVMAPVMLTKILCADLILRRGAILNVASMAAFQPTPFMCTYGASKSFILNWSISLDAELAAKGCIVRALCPGPCATDFFSSAGYDPSILPDNVTVSNEDVVKCGLHLLTKSKPYGIAGAKNRILNIMSRMMPLGLSGRLAHMAMRHVLNKKGKAGHRKGKYAKSIYTRA
jgi:short-subunit dehydrogenase